MTPKPRLARATCNRIKHQGSPPPTFREIVLESLYEFFYETFRPFLDLLRLIRSLWPPRHETRLLPAPPPLHPAAEVIRQELLALEPMASHRNGLRALEIDIAIPAYLAGTDLVCHVYEALDSLSLRYGPPSFPVDAAFTAMGYDMCRISSDYLPCNAPEKIMLLEYNHARSLVMASWIRTPIHSWACETVAWDAFQMPSKNGAELLRHWLNNIITTNSPANITVRGSNSTVQNLIAAIHGSEAEPLLVLPQEHNVSTEHVVEFGAARKAKELLDRQPDDCIEDGKCERIRRKADKIAGAFQLSTVHAVERDAANNKHADL